MEKAITVAFILSVVKCVSVEKGDKSYAWEMIKNSYLDNGALFEDK